jgi:CubicO group peptidase (beta-lactamase class C family)
MMRSSEQRETQGQREDAEFTLDLERICSRYRLPSLGAVMFNQESVLKLAVVGRRKINFEILAEPDDVYHLGSLSKSFTATLAARLVESGRIRWNSTVSEVLSSTPMRPEFRDVTLETLLSHRAGLIPNPPHAVDFGANIPYETARHEYLSAALQSAAVHTPGTGYMYSNAGYVTAAAMLECVCDASWESLMAEEIFKPLGLQTASVGVDWPTKSIAQPWPHLERRAFILFGPRSFKALEPTRAAGNPPALNGADNVRCALEDLARYAQVHLQGHFSDRPFLSRASFQRLHTDPTGKNAYALGWSVLGDGKLLAHDGSNTLNYARLLMSLERKRGLAIVTNCGGNGAQTAMTATQNAILKYFEKS